MAHGLHHCTSIQHGLSKQKSFRTAQKQIEMDTIEDLVLRTQAQRPHKETQQGIVCLGFHVATCQVASHAACECEWLMTCTIVPLVSVTEYMKDCVAIIRHHRTPRLNRQCCP